MRALFFLGYFLFEAPANMILAKVGARLWFARIMGTWGLITVALGFTQDATMFYVLRFLLGVAEAGFFPGVLFVLTLWYPQARRAQMVGWFMIASAVANAVGSLIGGALLELDGLAGLAGWQWVFLATGAPAVLLVPLVLIALPSTPDQARFLSAADKAWLAADTRRRAQAGAGRLGLARIARSARAAAGHPLFRHAARRLRAQLLAADDRQGLRRLEPAERGHQRDPLDMRRASPCGRCRATPRGTAQPAGTSWRRC